MSLTARLARWSADRIERHLSWLDTNLAAVTDQAGLDALPWRTKAGASWHIACCAPYAVLIMALGWVNPDIWKEEEPQ